MSSPMFDLPDHVLIPIDEEGNGPVSEEEAHCWGCWCGDPYCQEW